MALINGLPYHTFGPTTLSLALIITDHAYTLKEDLVDMDNHTFLTTT